MATTKHKRAFKEVVNGSSLTKAMRSVGYSEETSKRTNKLTNTKGWQELMAEHLPDKELALKHKELLNQQKVEYFTFSKSLSDQEIEEHVFDAGLKVIVIKETDKGKLAFYSTPDTNAKKGALEMAYKLKGSFAPEKTMAINLNANIEDPRTIELAHEYEEKIKKGL